MLWIIVIAIIALIVIVSLSNDASQNAKARKEAEFNTLAQSRIDAYADFLRRTSAPVIAGMTGNELRDFLQTHVRGYAAEKATVNDMFQTLFGIAVAIGVGLGFYAGSFMLAFLVGVSALILCGIACMKAEEAVDQKYRQFGVEPDRLKIQG